MTTVSCVHPGTETPHHVRQRAHIHHEAALHARESASRLSHRYDSVAHVHFVGGSLTATQAIASWASWRWQFGDLAQSAEVAELIRGRRVIGCQARVRHRSVGMTL